MKLKCSLHTMMMMKMMLICIITSSVIAEKNNEAQTVIATGVNKFSGEFFEAAAKNASGNLVCSPLSAHVALSMVAFGARNSTENELQTKLHLPDDKSLGKNGYQSLIETLNNIEGVKLYLANKIFTTQTITLKPEFKETMKTYFRSDVQCLDFNATENSLKTINEWCRKKTNGYIEEIVTSDDVKEASILVLSAVYFKGKWSNPFEQNETKPMAFNIAETDVKQVPMMQTSGSYHFGTVKDFDAKYIELPYETKNEETISMYIIVPKTISHLKSMLKNFHKINFKKLRGSTRSVQLYVPKFKIESNINLENVGTDMGLHETFGDNADFGDISDGLPLIISKAIQKVFIEVSEEGTTGAAASSLKVMTKSMISTFIVDKPFVCTIVMKATGTPLFTSIVMNPL